MRFYSDQDRENWAAAVNELALDYMKRLAIESERHRREEHVLRSGNERLSMEKRRLENALREEIGERLGRIAAYTPEALKNVVNEEIREIVAGQR